MTKRSLFSIVVAAVFGLLIMTSVLVTGQSADPFVGTWKLNIAKSKFNPGPAPKGQTVTISAVGDQVRVIADTEYADGRKIHTEFTAGYDGKDVPITGSAAIDTVAVKRTNPRTVDRTDKKAGKVVATLHATVSADNKTMTVNQTGTNAAGQKVDNVGVADRQ